MITQREERLSAEEIYGLARLVHGWERDQHHYFTGGHVEVPGSEEKVRLTRYEGRIGNFWVKVSKGKIMRSSAGTESPYETLGSYVLGQKVLETYQIAEAQWKKEEKMRNSEKERKNLAKERIQSEKRALEIMKARKLLKK